MKDDYNPTRLSRVELLMIMNGTSQGEMLTDHKLREFKSKGGLRFTKGQKYDLIRFIAYLVDRYETTKPPSVLDKDAYEKHKAVMRERTFKQSLIGREIGAPPDVKNPARRESCRLDIALFYKIYYPKIFIFEWSDDHIVIIARIQNAILIGGLQAMAMPRGFGKTSLCMIACIWAQVYGHQSFIALIAADSGHAIKMLAIIKSSYEHNKTLADDFPEICHPIKAIGGNSQRTGGQICDGQRTEITWKTDEIILPTVKDSKASGSIIQTAGITGGIRGMIHILESGEIIRPGLVIIDDPQTDESAASLTQNVARINILNGTILNLAGPGEAIAAFMPCTVIAPGDMADQMLDIEEWPDWQGFRTKMLKEFPKNMDIWEKYGEVRAESLRRIGNISEATEFYKKNREKMDEGAIASWPQNFKKKIGEISAVQSAMNLFFRSEETFMAESQNEPMVKDLGDTKLMTADQIAAKVNNYDRRVIPEACQTLTAFVDVQKKVLYYTILAWEDNGTSYIIDYGAYPEQQKEYYTLRGAKRSYQDVKTDINGNKIVGGFEAQLHAALEMMTYNICARTWTKDGGIEEMSVDLLMYDGNWSQSTKTIHEHCRTSIYKKQIKTGRGKYFGAATQAMNEYKKKKGDRLGHNWRMLNPKGKTVIREVQFDSNYWKMWCHERFQVSIGGEGCMSLFGKDPKKHKMFADQIVSEQAFLIEGRGRKVLEFKLKPSEPDNHLLDCIVGSAVAASVMGVKIKGVDQRTNDKPKKVRRRMSDVIAEKKKKR